MIELYASLCRPPGSERRRFARAAPATRASLRAIGQRALKPLLEALASGDASTRNLAIEVLGASESQAALLPLLTAAEHAGDLGLRRRALIALGPIATEAVVERLVAIAQGDELRLRDAAAWALSQLALARRSAKAERAALALATSETPAVRGFALLGLLNARGKDVVTRASSVLEHDRSPWARGAAALVLGHAGAREAVQPLVAALQVESDEVSAAAALALGCSKRTTPAGLAARTGSELFSRAAACALADGASALARSSYAAPPADRVSLSGVLAQLHAARARCSLRRPLR